MEGRADDGAKRERVADADIPAGHADRNDDPLMTPSQKKKRHDDEQQEHSTQQPAPYRIRKSQIASTTNDVPRSFQLTDHAPKFQKNIEKKAEAYEKKLTENQEKIRKAEEAGESKKKLEKLITEIQEKMMPEKQELINLQSAFENELLGEVKIATKQTAKEMGIETVVNKTVILYGGTDLTSFVLHKLNE